MTYVLDQALWFAILSSLVTVTFQACNSSDYTPDDNKNHPMPLFSSYLQNEFQTNVEVNLISASTVTYVQEFYLRDAESKEVRGSTVMHLNEVIRSWYYFTKPNQLVYRTAQYHNETCSTKDFRNPPGGYYGWMYSSTDNSDYLIGPTALLKLADSLNKKYVGTSTFRDIEAENWQACQDGVTIDYYFANKDWTLPYGTHDEQWPLGMKIVEDKTVPGETSSLNYEYVYGSFSQILANQDALLIPGVGACVGLGSIVDRQIPEIPNVLSFSFSYNELHSRSGTTSYKIFNGRIEYDGLNRVLRMDVSDLTKGNRSSPEYVKVVLDYNTGAGFYINQKTGNCTTETLPASLEEAGSLDNFGQLQGFYELLIDPVQALTIDDHYAFVGSTQIRGIQVDKWISDLTEQVLPVFDPDKDKTGSITYHVAGAGVKDDGGNDLYGTPVKMDVYMKNVVSYFDEYSINFYNFQSLTSSPYKIFNVKECFDRQQSNIIVIEFLTKAIGTFVVEEDPVSFTHALYNHLISLTNMSAVRVADIQFATESSRIANFVTTAILILPPVPSIHLFHKQTENSKPGRKEEAIPQVLDVEDCAEQCLNNNGGSEVDCMAFHYCGTTCYLSPYNTTSIPPQPGSQPCPFYIKDPIKTARADPTINQIIKIIHKEIREKKFNICAQHCEPGDKSRVSYNAASAVLVPDFFDNPYAHEFHILKSSYKLKYPDYKVKQMSGGACAAMCARGLESNCDVFAYCPSRQLCMVTSVPMSQLNKTDFKPDKECTVYSKHYLDDYIMVRGSMAKTQYTKMYENILNPNDCAKECTLESSFTCHGFDYCPSLTECFLHKDHFLDPSDDTVITNVTIPGCIHYAREYFSDYDFTQHAEMTGGNSWVISLAGEEACSQQCTESPTCQSFSVCRKCDKEAEGQTDVCAAVVDEGKPYCVLTDQTMSNGKVTKTSNCNLFTSDYHDKGDNYNYSSSKSSGNYSAGAMAGLAFGMIFLGILLVVGVLMFVQVRLPALLSYRLRLPMPTMMQRTSGMIMRTTNR